MCIIAAIYTTACCLRKTLDWTDSFLAGFFSTPDHTPPPPPKKKKYCTAKNFRQRKISSKATVRQFVRNLIIFSSNGSLVLSSVVRFACLSVIFTFMTVSDPTLVEGRSESANSWLGMKVQNHRQVECFTEVTSLPTVLLSLSPPKRTTGKYSHERRNFRRRNI